MSMGGTSAQPQSFWNVGDPANLSGHASSSSILQNLADPGDVLGLNPAASGLPPNGGIPGVLPNLGAAATMPRLPHGAFAPASTGGGLYNAMALAGAGPLFNPEAAPPVWPQSAATRAAAGTQGQVPIWVRTLPARRVQR